jgi:hypothetical protein
LLIPKNEQPLNKVGLRNTMAFSIRSFGNSRTPTEHETLRWLRESAMCVEIVTTKYVSDRVQAALMFGRLFCWSWCHSFKETNMSEAREASRQIELRNYNLDLNFRPATYWNEAKAARANITGTLRRDALERALLRGDDHLAFRALDDAAGASARESLGAIHPSFRSGEDLRPVSRAEVEIARITLDSVHGEVTSIRARLRNGRIHYRVEDECANEFGYKIAISPRSSKLPLTLPQFITLINSARWDNQTGLVTPHWRTVLSDGESAAASFVRISSYFYPQLASWYAADLKALCASRSLAANAVGGRR